MLDYPESEEFDEPTCEWLAVKVLGIGHYIWFERKNTSEDEGYFTGRSGSGEDGAFTELHCPVLHIEARIDSDMPQY